MATEKKAAGKSVFNTDLGAYDSAINQNISKTESDYYPYPENYQRASFTPTPRYGFGDLPGESYSGYEDKYSDSVTNMLNSLQSQNKFQYDPYTDPQYQAYRKQYLREGQRAMQNTMANAAAMTGGRPSSYAVSAAAQANNNYAAQAANMIPQLYEQAYNRYLQEYQKNAQTVGLLQNQQQNDYNRYSQDRGFDYQAKQDYLQNEMRQRQIEYDIYNQDRAFNYQKRQNALHNMQTQQSADWSRFMQAAQMAYTVGDYKQLEALGFDTSRADFDNQLAMAQLIAQYTGDTSRIRALMNR